jgi:hypothetical protein
MRGILSDGGVHPGHLRSHFCNTAFYQNDRGQTRFTVSPEARRELLKRVLELNLAAHRLNVGNPLRTGT